MTSPKTLLVGLNNPISNDPRDALVPWPAGCSGHRLWQYMRLVRPEFTATHYTAAFDRGNLWGGCELPTNRKLLEREGAQLMRSISLEGRRAVVLLGVKVWASVVTPYAPRTDTPAFFTSREIDGCTFWYLPHPSGGNFLFNSLERRRRAGEILVSLMGEGS